MITYLDQEEQVVADWRLGLDDAELPNPAGPLFISGRYAAAEITAHDPMVTPACPTIQWTPCTSWCLECGPVIQ